MGNLLAAVVVIMAVSGEAAVDGNAAICHPPKPVKSNCREDISIGSARVCSSIWKESTSAGTFDRM